MSRRGDGPESHGQCGKAPRARQPLPMGHRALAAAEVLPGKDEVMPAVSAHLLLPGRGLSGTVPSPKLHLWDVHSSSGVFRSEDQRTGGDSEEKLLFVSCYFLALLWVQLVSF